MVADAPERVQRGRRRSSPLIAGAVAFGIGALVTVLLPETEPEQRAARAAVQPQLAAATEAIKDAVQHSRPAKSSAEDAVADLKDSATDHAHEVTEQAKTATEQVKETAQQVSTQSAAARKE